MTTLPTKARRLADVAPSEVPKPMRPIHRDPDQVDIRPPGTEHLNALPRAKVESPARSTPPHQRCPALVYQELEKSSRPLRSTELANILGWPREAVYIALMELHSEGKVTRIGKGAGMIWRPALVGTGKPAPPPPTPEPIDPNRVLEVLFIQGPVSERDIAEVIDHAGGIPLMSVMLQLKRVGMVIEDYQHAATRWKLCNGVRQCRRCRTWLHPDSVDCTCEPRPPAPAPTPPSIAPPVQPPPAPHIGDNDSWTGPAPVPAAIINRGPLPTGRKTRRGIGKKLPERLIAETITEKDQWFEWTGCTPKQARQAVSHWRKRGVKVKSYRAKDGRIIVCHQDAEVPV